MFPKSSVSFRDKYFRKLFLIEWRPYVPQHIGITQYEERLFRLGAYSQYNVWNENADLIHEFLFFGGNWPKHEDLDLMAEEIDDCDTLTSSSRYHSRQFPRPSNRGLRAWASSRRKIKTREWGRRFRSRRCIASMRPSETAAPRTAWCQYAEERRGATQ